MSVSDIKALLEKYYSGETTLEEERLLENHFASGAEADLQAEQMLFQGRVAYRKMAAPVTIRIAGQDSDSFNQSGMSNRSWVWRVCRVAACLAVVILLLRIWTGFPPAMQDKSKPQDEIQLSLTKLIQDSSPAKRLQAIDHIANQVSNPEPVLLKTVGSVLLKDESPAVRMAAASLLSDHSIDPNVKADLSRAVEQEIDPVVKIILIQMTLQHDRTTALHAAGRLLDDPDVPEEMKNVVKNL